MRLIWFSHCILIIFINSINWSLFIIKTGYNLCEPTIQRILAALSPGIKRPGCKIDQSSPYNAKVKNECSCTTCLHSMHREKLYVIFLTQKLYRWKSVFKQILR
jgi:hypothetical protein